MKSSRPEWILERVSSIVDRWDKEEYTKDSLPMRGLVSDLRQVLREERAEGAEEPREQKKGTFIETQLGRLYNAAVFHHLEAEGNTIRAYFDSESFIFLGAYGSEDGAKKALKALGERLEAVNVHEFEEPLK